MDVSIIIVTRNRAEHLKETLQSMIQIHVPEGMTAELVIVDNGSTDGTREVVATHHHGKIPTRYLVEQKMGKSNGLNSGMNQSRGNIFLFTDDDVRPPVDWLDGMCDPLTSGIAHAVAGGVKLAPKLIRPWMTTQHRSWLAATEWLTPGSPRGLVGANMAISRTVLDRVPEFDPELGGGGLGFFEDVLFGSQVQTSGFGIYDCLHVCVEHHFDPSRLNRESWLNGAEKRGESHAYMGHHWEHWRCRFGAVKSFVAGQKLNAWRNANQTRMTEDGCSPEELDLVYRLAVIRHHHKISHRARNYEHHGLIKRTA